jgi:acyl carrier protein
MQQTSDRVLSVLAEQITGRTDTAGQLKREQHLAEDLHCDSLDKVEIALALEDAFNISIDDDNVVKLQTVGQVIDHVTELYSKAGGEVVEQTPQAIREQQIAVLRKAAIDAAVELDHAKNSPVLSVRTSREQMESVRDRVYAAADALFPDLDEDPLEQARRLVGTGIEAQA